MLKCKETIELASMQFDTQLPRLKQLELKMHLLMCQTCRQYVKHLNFIQKFTHNLEQNFSHIKLPDRAKTRIKNHLDRF